MIERVTDMRTSLKMLMRDFRTGRIMDSFCELALEVWGENRMDCAAMNMTLISMSMIRIGMHVEKWNHEHPDGYPRENQQASTG